MFGSYEFIKHLPTVVINRLVSRKSLICFLFLFKVICSERGLSRYVWYRAMVIDTGSLLFQLVCEAILSSARELGFEEDEMIDIALVHVAHSRIQSRLRCFSKLVQAKPEVMEKLKEVPVFREKQAEVVSWLVRLSTRPSLSVAELSDEDVKNNWLCKQNNSSENALRFLICFFDFRGMTTMWNVLMERCIRSAGTLVFLSVAMINHNFWNDMF